MNTPERTTPSGFRYFHIVAMLFVTSICISNTIAVKVITVMGLTLPAGIITFPFAYLAGDVLTEVYGFRKTRTIIWWGFFCVAGMSAFYWLATILPPAIFWKDNDAAFASFFGFVPRIVASSLAAYFVGEYLNSVVMSRMKVKMQGRSLWARCVASTVVGEGADSIIFNFAAFSGVFPIKTVAFIAFSGFVLKTLWEIIALPITLRIVPWLKRAEGVDTYDHDVRYTPIDL